MKKVNDANPNSPIETGIKIGKEVFDAEQYQLIRRQQVKQSPIMDLDAIQREMFAIKPRVIEGVMYA